MGASGQDARLLAILRASPLVMRVLEAARAVAAPQWLVGAGIVRDTVWDHLHGRAHARPPRDVDLAFFDPDKHGADHDRRISERLRRRCPEVAWDAVNQAGVHRWYERRSGVAVPPLTSAEEGVATWPETCTAVAVRLDHRGRLRVVAPFGLADLLTLTVRHNPARVSVRQFHERVARKRWTDRWPGLRVVPPLPPGRG